MYALTNCCCFTFVLIWNLIHVNLNVFYYIIWICLRVCCSMLVKQFYENILVLLWMHLEFMSRLLIDVCLGHTREQLMFSFKRSFDVLCQSILLFLGVLCKASWISLGAWNAVWISFGVISFDRRSGFPWVTSTKRSVCPCCCFATSLTRDQDFIGLALAMCSSAWTSGHRLLDVLYASRESLLVGFWSYASELMLLNINFWA